MPAPPGPIAAGGSAEPGAGSNAVPRVRACSCTAAVLWSSIMRCAYARTAGSAVRFTTYFASSSSVAFAAAIARTKSASPAGIIAAAVPAAGPAAAGAPGGGACAPAPRAASASSAAAHAAVARAEMRCLTRRLRATCAAASHHRRDALRHPEMLLDDREHAARVALETRIVAVVDLVLEQADHLRVLARLQVDVRAIEVAAVERLQVGERGVVPAALVGHDGTAFLPHDLREPGVGLRMVGRHALGEPDDLRVARAHARGLRLTDLGDAAARGTAREGRVDVGLGVRGERSEGQGRREERAEARNGFHHCADGFSGTGVSENSSARPACGRALAGARRQSPRPTFARVGTTVPDSTSRTAIPGYPTFSSSLACHASTTRSRSSAAPAARRSSTSEVAAGLCASMPPAASSS